MKADAMIEPAAFPALRRGSFAHQAVGLVLGILFTASLFLGIAHYEKGAPGKPPANLDDLRVALSPVEPPPLPAAPVEPPAQIVPVPGFDFEPSESPVKVTVSPPDLATLLPEDLSKAPIVHARVTTLPGEFKPRMDLVQDAQHIYQRSEVDRPPQVLERPNPQVSNNVRDNAKALHVTLLVVVDSNGTVGRVRLTKTSGNEAFDKLMMESITEWVFSPAMKNGRNVRCLIEQGITVQWSAGSVFST